MIKIYEFIPGLPEYPQGIEARHYMTNSPEIGNYRLYTSDGKLLSWIPIVRERIQNHPKLWRYKGLYRNPTN